MGNAGGVPAAGKLRNGREGPLGAAAQRAAGFWTGATEYLLTNLRHGLALPGQLYGRRWGVESDLDVMKNVPEVENFSAKTGQGVLQDFRAAVLWAHISALLVEEAQRELDRGQEGNRHRCQVNRAVALGLGKGHLVGLLLGTQPMETAYQGLKTKIKRRREAVKPGRKFKRKRHRGHKFKSNKRKVM